MLKETIVNEGKDDEEIVCREITGKVVENEGRNSSELAINVKGFGDYKSHKYFSYAVLGGFEGKNIKLTVELMEEEESA